MEFINYEREYAKDFKEYCNQNDVIALKNVYSSELLSTFTHASDNGFIETSFGKTIHQLSLRNCQFLGTARAPWVHRGDDLAVIYEDVNTFETFWCHINNKILTWWVEQAEQSEGRIF